MFSQIVSRILAFSVSFVLARTLGLSSLAVLALAQSVMAYATVAGDAGLGTEAVRRLSGGENKYQVVKDTVSLQLVLTVIALVIVVPVSILQVGVNLSLALALTPVATALTCSYVLQADLDAINMAVARVLMNVVTGVVGIALVLISSPLWVVSLAYGLGAVASMMFTNSKAKVVLATTFRVPKISSLPRGRRSFGALLGVTTVVHAYSSALLILAAFLTSGSLLIDTSVATRFLLLLVLPAQILGSMLLPRYARLVERPRLLTHALVAFLAGVFIAGVTTVVAEGVVPFLLGPEAVGSVSSVVVLGWHVPFALASTIYSSYFLSRGRYHTVFVLYTVALIVLVVCALVLSPWGSEAYVASLVVSEIAFVSLLMLAEKVRRSE